MRVIMLLLCVSSARIAVIKISGPTILCRSDEVGEICVQSGASGSGFYGLPGKTANVFQVRGYDVCLRGGKREEKAMSL